MALLRTEGALLQSCAAVTVELISNLFVWLNAAVICCDGLWVYHLLFEFWGGGGWRERYYLLFWICAALHAHQYEPRR